MNSYIPLLPEISYGILCVIMMSDIIQDNNTSIMYRRWLVDTPEAILLLVHGLGAHSGRWSYLSEYFQPLGYSSYAIELPGFGATTGTRGHISSFDIYYEHILSISRLIREREPGKEIILVGESMGGLISFLMVSKYPRVFDRVILLSPAFGNKMVLSPAGYLMLIFYLIFYPKGQIRLPFKADMCTGDSEIQEILRNDPLELRSASARLLFEILLAQVKTAGIRDISVKKILFLLSGNDKLADENISKKIFSNINAEKALKIYPDMNHSLSIADGRGKVFEDMFKWINGSIL